MEIHIIGAGIIGMSTAYHLSTYKNCRITVFEKDKSFNQASFARSCGGCRAQYSTKTNIEFSRYSISFIKTQTNVEFTPNGYLMLFGHNQVQDHDASIELQKSLGASTKSLKSNQLKILFPDMNFNDVYRGCVTQDGSEGWIDPNSLHSWYKDHCLKNNVKFEYVDGTKADHGSADAIVICSGCWSNSVAQHFNFSIPVIGHKHTVYYVSTADPQIKTLPLVADLITGVYLRPEGNQYIVGYDGNGEFDSFDLEPNLNCWDTVWEHLYHRFPTKFDRARLEGAWAGYYDTSTLDNNAIIDSKDNIFFATGFTGRGLMHSPAVGLTLSEMVLGKTTSFDCSDYKLDRIKNIEKYVI